MEKKDIKSKIKFVTGAAALSLFLTSCGSSDVEVDSKDNDKKVVSYLDEEEYIAKFKNLNEKMGPNVSEVDEEIFDNSREVYVSQEEKDYLYTLSAYGNATSEEAKKIYKERLGQFDGVKDRMEIDIIQSLLYDFGMNINEVGSLLNFQDFSIFYKDGILHFMYDKSSTKEGENLLDYNSSESQRRYYTSKNHYSFVVADSSLDNVSEFLFSTSGNNNCNYENLEEDYYKVMSSDYQFEYEASSEETIKSKCDNDIIDVPYYMNVYDVTEINNHVGVVYNYKNMENLKNATISEGISVLKSGYVYGDKKESDFRISKTADGKWIISENGQLIGELNPDETYLANFIGNLQGRKSNSDSKKISISVDVSNLVKEINNYKVLTGDKTLGNKSK